MGSLASMQAVETCIDKLLAHLINVTHGETTGDSVLNPDAATWSM